MTEAKRPFATKRTRAALYLEAARRIAQRETDYIASDPWPRRTATLPSDKDYDRLAELFGTDIIWFDDLGDDDRPGSYSRHERVVFLCFAAAIEERP